MQTKIQNILKRLLHLHPKSVDLSLYRIERLLKDLSNPENKIQNAIQVVGTNGKHSVCSTLREIFEQPDTIMGAINYGGRIKNYKEVLKIIIVY